MWVNEQRGKSIKRVNNRVCVNKHRNVVVKCNEPNKRVVTTNASRVKRQNVSCATPRRTTLRKT